TRFLLVTVAEGVSGGVSGRRGRAECIIRRRIQDKTMQKDAMYDYFLKRLSDAVKALVSTGNRAYLRLRNLKNRD
ncbi:MAG: hypothetical protein LUF01_15700, partial [Bacteroides sp.]|nr:hypothetical protein [Bacteroides sp.]